MLTRNAQAKSDTFIFTSDPDALFAEYQLRGLEFHEPLADTDDGFRAFELKDHDGYVCVLGDRVERRWDGNGRFYANVSYLFLCGIL